MENSINKPVRVLQVIATMNRGGAEVMIMNYYRAMDRTKIQFDFLLNYPERSVFEDEIETMGGRIFKSLPIRPWSYHRYFSWLDKFFAEHQHEWVAIHSHIQENSGIVFKYAAKYGFNRLIANSHIADLGIDLRYPFREFGKWFLRKYATDRFACGYEAGLFLYGKKTPFIVFKNAIKVSDFVYNSKIDFEVRSELNIDSNAKVIGHVGRFMPQKNHEYLIDIFKEIHSLDNTTVLLLCGKGGLEDKIKQKVQKYGLDRSVKFLGVRNDVNRIMQAMNVLLFPSIFEGLPVSIIEAQAAGLQCILSDTIDKDTDVTGNCQFLPLSKSPKEWATIVLDACKYERKDMTENIQKAGYDVDRNAVWLANYYLGRNNGEVL